MFKIPRLPWDSYFMLQAHLVATRATCDRGPSLFFDSSRHGVGCVIVRDRRIIASGYNGAPGGLPQCDEPEHGHLMSDGHCVRVIHSELNALLQCALDESSPKGCTIYTTASPCFDCAKAIIRAGIYRVVIGAYYESRYGLSSQSAQLFVQANIEVDEVCLQVSDYEDTRLSERQVSAGAPKELVLEALQLGLESLVSIAVMTNLPEDVVKMALVYWEKSGKAYLQHGRWHLVEKNLNAED